MANYAKTVINVALGEVGYREKKSNKYLDSKTKNAGANNYTKYNKVMKQIGSAGSLTDYWCANFTSWCFYKAYGKKTGAELMLGYENYVPDIYANFKAKNRTYTSYNAKPGDIIIFANKSHVGIVYKVTEKYVYTVEGNTSSGAFNANGGAVCKKKYAKGSTTIYCVCRPKYTKPISEYPTLQRGDTGAYVKKLQNQLNKHYKKLGYKKLEVTGKYGAKTENAVLIFKKKHKLVKTKLNSKVGTETWKKLYK